MIKGCHGLYRRRLEYIGISSHVYLYKGDSKGSQAGNFNGLLNFLFSQVESPSRELTSNLIVVQEINYKDLWYQNMICHLIQFSSKSIIAMVSK